MPVGNRKVITQIENTVDADTGELIGRTIVSHTQKFKTRKEFTMTFYQHESIMMNISLAATRTLYWCGRHASATSREIALNKLSKTRIAELSGFNIRTIANAITELVENQMLVRIAHGVYMVNPETCYKGDLATHGNCIEVYNKYILEPENG